MERLTRRDKSGNLYWYQSIWKRGVFVAWELDRKRILEKLAAYEDAEDEGRIIPKENCDGLQKSK